MEGQAGIREKRSCVDNILTLNEIVQGRMREGKHTYAFFLDVQKVFDKVWHDGLWLPSAARPIIACYGLNNPS